MDPGLSIGSLNIYGWDANIQFFHMELRNFCSGEGVTPTVLSVNEWPHKKNCWGSYIYKFLPVFSVSRNDCPDLI